MLSAIAIDDEPLALEIIKGYTEQLDIINLSKTFVSTQKAREYLLEYPVDLLFLDIHMPKINGIDFFKSLKIKPLVIFTTAYREYAVDGFNVDAIDYLLKPIDFERFRKSVIKANEVHIFNLEKNTQVLKYIFVRAEYQLVKICLHEIEYIEGLNDYVKIYTSSQSPILSLISMKEILQKLPTNNFQRIHRSYIVPLDKLTSFTSRFVYIQKNAIPIGDTYRDKVKNILK